MADDREALAEVLMATVRIPGPLRAGRGEAIVLTSSEALRAVDAILDSEWLAERLADERRRALREAADAIERQSGPATDFHGRPFAIVGSQWLRERADREQP